MNDTSLVPASQPVSRRQVARLALGLASVVGLGAVGISTVRAKHGDDDWGEDGWVVVPGGSGGTGGLDEDWVVMNGGSGGSGDWVFGSGGSGGSGDDDWFDD